MDKRTVLFSVYSRLRVLVNEVNARSYETKEARDAELAKITNARLAYIPALENTPEEGFSAACSSTITAIDSTGHNDPTEWAALRIVRDVLASALRI